MRGSVRLAVAVGVMLVALGVGCGGGSDEGSPSPTGAASDPRSAEQLAADRAQAERAVLRLADFPPGWTGEPDTDEAGAEEEVARERFAACLGVDQALVGGGARAGAKAESDEFEDDENRSVQNTVTMVFSRERALQQLEIFGRPEARGCFEEFVNGAVAHSVGNPGPGETAPPGITFGEARVNVLRPAGLDADAVGYRARVPVTVEDETADVLLDIVLALKGRAGITMIFMSIGEPFPSALETSLTNKVIDRAPAA